MKYIIATCIYVCLLMFGWFASASWLSPVIMQVFRPDGNDQYLNIWATLFVTIEGVITVIYGVTLYRMYRAGKVR